MLIDSGQQDKHIWYWNQLQNLICKAFSTIDWEVFDISQLMVSDYLTNETGSCAFPT